MSDFGACAIVIIIGVIIAVIVIKAKRSLRRAAYKASDAVRNKMIDKQEEKNPPQQENLADRFNNEM